MRSRGVVGVLALLTGLVAGAAGCSEGSSVETARDGSTIEVMYAFSGSQATGFQEAVDAWAGRHDVQVSYSGSDDLTTDLRARIAAGNPPDLAVLPQPGLAVELARERVVEPLDDVLPISRVASGMVPGIVAPLQTGGRTYGIPVAMNVKSLLWYDRHALHDVDIDPPQSMDDLAVAGDRLRDHGSTPWCLGIEDGANSGWAATDWVEELVLKGAGPEVYDQWVTGQVPFSDDRIKAAFATYVEVLRHDGVEGGGPAAARRDVRQAADGLFAEPQRCALLKQGSYVTQQGFLPERVRKAIDQTTSVVAFPSGDNDAIEVGGDSAVLLRGHDPAARDLVRYVGSDPRFGADWAGSEDRGFISPREDFDLERYASTTTRKIASAAYQAQTVRFDASDQMPPALGSEAFAHGMVGLTAGTVTVDQLVAQLDAARAKKG